MTKEEVNFSLLKKEIKLHAIYDELDTLEEFMSYFNNIPKDVDLLCYHDFEDSDDYTRWCEDEITIEELKENPALYASVLFHYIVFLQSEIRTTHSLLNEKARNLYNELYGD